MRPQSLRTAMVAAALGGLAACASDSSITAPSEQATLEAQRATTSAGAWDYHAGDAFLAALNPAFAPAIATASNGDRLELSGTGTLATHPKAVTGGGTFTHKNAAGAVLGSGTWTATKLLSFRSYGPSPVPGFPPDFEAGIALIKVHISPAAGGPGFDGVLRITCTLPDTFVPRGSHEGVRLAVEDVINFNKEAGGATLFVRQ